jgi:fibro-slime domain-containing protein
MILFVVGVTLPACGPGDEVSVFPGRSEDAPPDLGVSPNVQGSGADAGAEGGRTPSRLCGNAVKNADTELCDDGNTQGGDGCSAECRTEPGWLCVQEGRPCVAIRCGDGVLAGDEDCDDGNAVSGDGCTASCRLEAGYKCVVPAQTCTPTVCGDGIREGAEQCDDGNLDPFDGCDPGCKVEPRCAGGACTSVCGDGLKFPGEPCDDGNTRSGDGCSATCQLEPGFVCTHATEAPKPTRDLYIAYRDFLSAASAGGHPDFMRAGQEYGLATGLVQPLLDMQGKPAFLSARGSAARDVLTTPSNFSSWYRDTSLSKKTVSTLTLQRQMNGTYRFSSDVFYPLDAASNTYPERHLDHLNISRNFLFTSELRIPFTYRGGEVLAFTGDDDVWVFVNGHLVVDLGGVKSAMSASVTLDASVAASAGLVLGGMYEFVVFQAERNPVRSEYTLSLTDFDRMLSQCASICGDGIKTPDEVCDDGTSMNTGGYGRCAADCGRRGPFCGDGVVQAEEGEQCDGTPGCTADCRLAANGPK